MTTTHHQFAKLFKIICCLSLFLVIACKKDANLLLSDSSNNQLNGNQALGIYPHSEEFKTTSLHGTTFLGNRTSCMKCHGSDFKGGSTKVACLNCHNYPHPADWAQPKNHGTYFAAINNRQKDIKDPLKRDFSECMRCHENKMNPAGTFKERHPEQFVACSTCHADIPHGQKFLPSLPTDKGPTPHDVYLENNPDFKGSCFSCHLNTTRSAPKPVDKCLKCHEGPPWEEPKEEDPTPTDPPK
jgi:hypothetical protein